MAQPEGDMNSVELARGGPYHSTGHGGPSMAMQSNNEPPAAPIRGYADAPGGGNGAPDRLKSTGGASSDTNNDHHLPQHPPHNYQQHYHHPDAFYAPQYTSYELQQPNSGRGPSQLFDHTAPPPLSQPPYGHGEKQHTIHTHRNTRDADRLEPEEEDSEDEKSAAPLRDSRSTSSDDLHRRLEGGGAVDMYGRPLHNNRAAPAVGSPRKRGYGEMQVSSPGRAGDPGSRLLPQGAPPPQRPRYESWDSAGPRTTSDIHEQGPYHADSMSSPYSSSHSPYAMPSASTRLPPSHYPMDVASVKDEEPRTSLGYRGEMDARYDVSREHAPPRAASSDQGFDQPPSPYYPQSRLPQATPPRLDYSSSDGYAQSPRSASPNRMQEGRPVAYRPNERGEQGGDNYWEGTYGRHTPPPPWSGGASPSPTSNGESDGDRNFTANGQRRQRRANTSADETAYLEQVFTTTQHPDRNMREELAAKMHWTSRSVQIWFQNRRAKVKRSGSGTSAQSTVEM